MANEPRIRPISNIDTATIKASNVTVKGIEKTASLMATDHSNASQHGGRIGLLQSCNYAIAEMELFSRQTIRSIDQLDKFLNTGVEASTYEIVSGWLIDHTRFVWDVLRGFFEPIVSSLFFAVFDSLVMVLFNCIFFFGLYLMIAK